MKAMAHRKCEVPHHTEENKSIWGKVDFRGNLNSILTGSKHRENVFNGVNNWSDHKWVLFLGREVKLAVELGPAAHLRL